MTQADLFNLGESKSRRDSGMKLAATHRASDLEMARTIARELIRAHGATTSDDVGQVLFQRHGIKSLGPAAGSIFRCPDFKPTGRWLKSARVSNHARRLMEWTFAEGLANVSA
jgi:hypothetical protein